MPGFAIDQPQDEAERGSRDPRDPGAGLGLALVAQVVNRHGGTLSTDVTYGSVVTVTVPRR